MVETNPQDNDMGIGIITDWDPFCTKDNVWQENIGRFKLNDPFYSVIKEDGTTAYIPQGKTLINSKKFILSKKTYFHYFTRTNHWTRPHSNNNQQHQNRN